MFLTAEFSEVTFHEGESDSNSWINETKHKSSYSTGSSHSSGESYGSTTGSYRKSHGVSKNITQDVFVLIKIFRMKKL